MYNNWLPLFSVMMAKDKLKKNKVTSDPPELMIGLFMPGTQPLHQFLMTNTVVDKAIATKQKNDAIQEKSDLDKKVIEVGTQIKVVKGHNDRREQAELDKAIEDLIVMIEPKNP